MEILNSIFESLCKTLKDSPALITIVIITMTITGWSFNIVEGNLKELNNNMIDVIENQTKIIERMIDEAEDTEEFKEQAKHTNDMLVEIKSKLSN